MSMKETHDAITDLHDIWVHLVDRCEPGREKEVDAVFEELGRFRLLITPGTRVIVTHKEFPDWRPTKATVMKLSIRFPGTPLCV